MHFMSKVSLLPLLVSSSALFLSLRRSPLRRVGFLCMFSSPSSSSLSNPSPPEIQIPLEKLEFNFARSSGPGDESSVIITIYEFMN